MRILFVLPRMVSGGVERVTLSLICGLQSDGHECLLALRRVRGELLDEARVLCPVHELAPHGLHQLVPNLAGLVRQWRPTHVVTAFADVAVLIWLAMRLAGSKARWVHGVHNTHAPVTTRASMFGRFRFWLDNCAAEFVYRRADRIEAVSDGMRGEIITGFYVTPERVVTEHHYVLNPAYRPYKSLAQHVYHRALIGPYLRRSYAHADAITPDSRFTADVLQHVAGVKATRVILLWADYDKFSPADAAPRSDSRFRLLFVGNASRRKGADVIPLLGRRLGKSFEIRCTSGLRTDRRGDTSDNITLLGRLTEAQLIQEYRACDAVLVPSRYEGFGYTALEAMACGKPVVGFRCGAVDEVVVEGETGLLCNIDDLDALETSCRRLASDRSEALQFGRAGRVSAVTTFTEECAADAYIALYQSLLEGNTAEARGG